MAVIIQQFPSLFKFLVQYMSIFFEVTNLLERYDATAG